MFWNKESEIVNNNISVTPKEIEVIDNILEQLLTGDFSDESVNDFHSELSFINKLKKVRDKFIAFEIDVDINSKMLTNSSKELLDTSRSIRDSATNLSSYSDSIEKSSSDMTSNFATVSSASEELSINMQSIAESTKYTEDFVSTISNNTDELTTAAEEIAKNTERATLIANKALSQVSATSEKVAVLEQASNEINNVISVISDISDQTKLLALNATIEAARAGEAGKGFAVVAKEVKDLSEQTNNATKDIKSRITIMQDATKNAIGAIDSIRMIISEVNDVVTTIAAASEEQSATTAEVSSSITNTFEHIKEISDRVSEGAIAISDVNKSISDVAMITKDVDNSIKKLSADTEISKDLVIKNFTQALEIDSHSSEGSLLVKNLKLPMSKQGSLNVPDEFCRFISAFDLGVEVFNREHIKIFEYVNKIHKLAKAGADLHEILTEIKDMASFVQEHFAHEEDTFEKMGWIGTEGHKAVHNNLLLTVTTIIRDAENGVEIDLMEILIFLKDWLFEHILVEDMQYTKPMIEYTNK